MNFYTSLIYKTVFVLFIFIEVAVTAQTADSSHYYRINKIEIVGNKKTKDRIILRELVKKEQDTFLLKNITRLKKRDEYNIFNTQLFIYDSLYCFVNDSARTVNYKIKVKERWYIWPIPFVDFLDRNLNTWWLNKDPDRLAYGMFLNIENFTGVKDRLILIFKNGYAKQLGFNYRLPYLNSKQTIGAYAQYVYNEYNKLNYITRSNKQQFVISDNEHLRIEHTAKAGLFYRPHLFLQHALDLYYNYYTISKTVNDLNKNYFFNGSQNTAYAGLSYKLTYDNRDNKIYPLKGNMFEMMVVKDGLDISDRSPYNNAYTILSYKKYFPIHSKFNFATLARTRFLNTEQQIPFAFNQALGYSNYIRGYEYYVIDGQNYFLTKNSLRFQLIKPKFHEVGILKKMKPFSTIPFYAYLNLFYDGGYVQEKYYKETNSLANSWQHGYGIGLDLITYYDLVLRLEYAYNKQKQGGFYIHLTSGF